ncbi:recombinase family protein [Thiotrichales bacterium 19S11-10]|nr:recombinase family protein [Thiotrichales bacterium 19S11-10]
MKYGYARVSTKKQGSSLDNQIKQLKQAGCETIFSESVSGASSKRPELSNLLAKVEQGDTIVVTAIDRLGRSLKDLIGIITDLNKKEIGFVSLKEQMNTKTDIGMLLFSMMCSIAEFERKLINRRIFDGVERAKEQGKYQGRKHSTDAEIRKEFVKKMQSGNYTVAYLAKMAKVSRATLYRWKKELDVKL